MDFSTFNRLVSNTIGVDERHIVSYTVTGTPDGVTIDVIWHADWVEAEPIETHWELVPPPGEEVLLGNGAIPGPDQEGT